MDLKDAFAKAARRAEVEAVHVKLETDEESQSQLPATPQQQSASSLPPSETRVDPRQLQAFETNIQKEYEARYGPRGAGPVDNKDDAGGAGTAADAELAELREAAQDGLKTRSKLYQQWARIMDNDPELMKKYKAAPTRSAKFEFRRQWAASKLRVEETKMAQKRSMNKQEYAKGVWMSFLRIVKIEGITVAQSIVQSCLARGIA